ncbi:MAG: hypothetical protein Q9M18_08105 [Mariprofundaceae bacterium]|nr:hypothetical protein [Mariprofundaceae bacterium]
MGLFSSFCSFVSSAVSCVASAVSSIGGVLASAATSLLKVAGPLLGPVGQVVQVIGLAMDILKPKENVEELGAKAMQSDKPMDDFDNTSDYIDHLRNDIKLDTEKFENASKVEKMARTAIGTCIAIKGVEEKKGFDIPMDTWLALGKIGLERLEGKSKEIDAIIETFKTNDTAKDLKDYVDGKLDAKTELEVGDKLADVYAQLEPEASKEAIEKRVMDAQVGG